MTTADPVLTPPYALDRDTVLERSGDHFDATISPSWLVGEYPHGGYLASLVLRGLSADAAGREPVSLTAAFVSAPGAGAAEIAVETLKAGRNFTTMSGRLLQGGKERVRVLATLAEPRRAPGPTRGSPAPPAMAPPEQCSPLSELMPGVAVSEADARVVLLTTPDDPWARGEAAVVTAWIAFSDGRPIDAFSLAFLADAFPPPVLALAPEQWVPTLEMTLHVLGHPEGTWLLGQYRSVALLDGLLDAELVLWDSSGRTVAVARQLALVTAG